MKASINTATFEELWLAFAQVMTDSKGPDNPLVVVVGATGTAVTHWQPPMQATYAQAANGAPLQPQMPMFRSVLRDSRTTGATILSGAQMLKLRAALAAINAIDLRDSDDDVSSKHIVLDDSYGNPQYDVEVYGTEAQPYITEVVIQTKQQAQDYDTYAAIELCNPYNKPMVLTNWQIGSLNRTAFPNMSMAPGIIIPTITIPAAKNGVPGLLVLYGGTTVPPDIQTTLTNNQTTYPTQVVIEQVPGLNDAAISRTGQQNELFIMRPRLANGNQLLTSAPLADDVFDETQSSQSVADLVPVDQIDLTGLKLPTTGGQQDTFRFLYRRGCDGTANKAWNFIYPGAYDPTSTNSAGRYFSLAIGGASAIVVDQTATQPCNLGAPDGGTGGRRQQHLHNASARVEQYVHGWTKPHLHHHQRRDRQHGR